MERIQNRQGKGTYTLGKQFASYVTLNMLGMFGISLYILADTFFIANGIGADGLAALNLVCPVYSVINGVALLLGMGGATKYALTTQQDLGRRRSVFTQTCIAALLVGLLFAFLGNVMTGPIVAFLGADPVTSPLAAPYAATMCSFACAFLLNQAMLCFVRNDGSPGLAMAAMLGGSLANIILDYVLIFPLGWGMFGAAFATGAAPLVSLLILSLHWVKKGESCLRFGPLTHVIHTARETAALGTAALITELSSGIVMFLFNLRILGLAGNLGVAAYGIIANLALVAVGIFTGLGQGIQPLVSRYFGEGKLELVQRLLRYGLLLALCMGGVLYVTGICFQTSLVALFNRENDPVLTQLAREGIRYYFPAFIFMGANIAASAFFSAAAKPVESILISMLRGALLVVPLICLLPLFWGMTGVWLVIPCVELLTFVFALVCYLHWRTAQTVHGMTDGEKRL